MLEIQAWCDGSGTTDSCGGWGSLLVTPDGSEVKRCGGLFPPNTNNTMEITAAIQTLQALDEIYPEPCRVVIHSDSAYVINAFNLGWIKKWRRNGWQGSAGDVKNQDLWRVLWQLSHHHDVTWVHVRGHKGIYGNVVADKLANIGRQFIERILKNE